MDWALISAAVVYLLSWLICIWMLYTVPRKRAPAAANAWLVFGFFLPFLALFVFSLIGSPKLPLARRSRQRTIDDTIDERMQKAQANPQLAPLLNQALDPSREKIARLGQRLGGLPAFNGNTVELLYDYDATIQRIAADIEAAKRSAHLLYYIFAGDPTANLIVDALCRAAQRGVCCRVIFDALGNRPYAGEHVARMRAAGVVVREALPLRIFGRGRTRPDLRNHRKIVVIDEQVGYTGSQNIVAAEFKPGVVYEELVARVTGPAVAQMQGIFLIDWISEGEDIDPSALREVSLPTPTGEVPCQLVPSGPAYDTDNIALLFAALLYQARRRAVLTTPYFIPDESLLAAIENAAMRGVDVHLVVSAQGDQFLVSQAQRSYYEEMLATGVQIHAVREPAFIHAKHISIDDDIAVIGSSNFDVRSFRLNLEIVMLAYDKSVVQAMRVIEDSYLARAEQLDLECWRQRPRRQQFVENTCRLLSALL